MNLEEATIRALQGKLTEGMELDLSAQSAYKAKGREITKRLRAILEKYFVEDSGWDISDVKSFLHFNIKKPYESEGKIIVSIHIKFSYGPSNEDINLAIRTVNNSDVAKEYGVKFEDIGFANSDYVAIFTFDKTLMESLDYSQMKTNMNKYPIPEEFAEYYELSQNEEYLEDLEEVIEEGGYGKLLYTIEGKLKYADVLSQAGYEELDIVLDEDGNIVVGQIIGDSLCGVDIDQIMEETGLYDYEEYEDDYEE